MNNWMYKNIIQLQMIKIKFLQTVNINTLYNNKQIIKIC